MKSKKLIIIPILIIVIAMIIGFVFMGNQSQNTEEIVNKFIEATYAGDTEQIVDMFPDVLSSRLEEDIVSIYEYETEEEILEKAGTSLTSYIELLDTLFGEGWTYEYAISDEYTYTDEELADLDVYYQLMGVSDMTLKGAKLYTVDVTLSAVNGTGGSATIIVPMIQTEGKWYIGQGIGEVYTNTADAGAYDIYGDLMDGFSITGIATEEDTDEEVETEVEEDVIVEEEEITESEDVELEAIESNEAEASEGTDDENLDSDEMTESDEISEELTLEEVYEAAYESE